MTSGADPFIGGGEVRALARAVRWEDGPLGPPERWSPTLRDVVRACLESPFPIALWCGPDLVFLYNDAYRSVLGAKHPAALGRPGPEVWREIWTEIEPMFRRIEAGGPPVFQVDAPFIVARPEDAADGAVGAELGEAGEAGEAEAPGGGGPEPNAWFTFALSGVRDAEGELVAFLNVVSESTGQVMAGRSQREALARAERAEARLLEVFAQAPAFMAVLRGEDHVFEYVNAAYYQLVGHRDLLGRPVLEALPEIRGQGFEDLLDEVLESGAPYIGREVAVTISRTPESDPEERYVDLVYYPITEVDGTRSGVVAHGSDVTEHVRARREAQRARAEAEQANLAKSQFLATMSHEIRTPINAVIGYTDLLEAGVAGSLTEKQADYVSSIRASSSHLLGLVSDILDLAKIEAGELKVGVEQTSLRAAVHAAIRLVTPQAVGKGLEVAEAWDCDEGTRVQGDEDRIRQVLLNLLSNAVKFTGPGGDITVRCRTQETAPAEAALPEVGPWVVVEVEDTGQGIPEAQLGRVFEAFVQVEGGHTRRAGGTGLGLTISRRLARLMGGELTVESEEGEGSRFTLWLAPGDQAGVPAREVPMGTEDEAWPPPPEERMGLASAGRTLLGSIERIEELWAERLRDDPRMPGADRVNRAQLLDQTAELVAATAKVLFILEEGGGDPGLLDDAQAIHTLVARRHGQQRRRLGWGLGELEREYALLADVLDATLRRDAPKRTAADLGTALGVVHRLVGRAARTSVAVFEGDLPPQSTG